MFGLVRFVLLCFRYFHGDVLQCVVRQIRDAADVWVLPELGPGVGIQEKGHLRRDPSLRRRHHQSPGA